MSSIINKENGRNGAVSTDKEKETNTEGIVEEGKNTKYAWDEKSAYSAIDSDYLAKTQ